MSLGRLVWREARSTLQDLLSVGGNNLLRSNPALRAKVLIPLSQVTNHMPATIGDYTDFYASKEHVQFWIDIPSFMFRLQMLEPCLEEKIMLSCQTGYLFK